jgi:hypothetical protein
MGVDYNSGMIIGACGEDIKKAINLDPTDLADWAEDNGLTTMSPWYDAPPLECYYGFAVDDISVNDIDSLWTAGLKEMSYAFEKLTTIKPWLFGAIDIT